MRTSAAGSRDRGAAHQGGYTLLEVLVALAIVAFVLAAGLGSMSALSRHDERQLDLLLARVCAENWLANQRLARRFPDVREFKLDCVQAERTYEVQASASATPNPNFRRVDVSIHREGVAVLQVSTVVGRY